MIETDKVKYMKYYTSPNRRGGNYYKDGKFDRDGSICVEAEVEYGLGIRKDAREKYKKSKAYSVLQGDEVPTDLKASLYDLWGLVVGGSDEEFVKFYSKMY